MFCLLNLPDSKNIANKKDECYSKYSSRHNQGHENRCKTLKVMATIVNFEDTPYLLIVNDKFIELVAQNMKRKIIAVAYTLPEIYHN